MKNFKILVFGTFAAIFFNGCDVTPPFQVVQLQENARGITVARSTPYNCTVLGEVEGRSENNGYGANLQLMRDSAVNDAKNNAAYVIGEGKRAMINIVSEKAVCLLNGQRVDCSGNVIGYVQSYRINAQVFDCGIK
ncbi:hypothetical protein [Campylobacter sp.]|uniref:hypothetical protein n=1 Tax=Campylobacter sp. TaxID=205 RepID=UPI0025C1714D|nr:hypothetical protein [Campylobacter sp.]